MLAKIRSFALNGLEGFEVSVEVDVNAGLPTYEIVGMGDTAVKESRERVRAAIKNSLLDYPIRRVTVNLAPADSKKEGSLYDLAIAVGILAATEQVPKLSYADYVIIGELGLDGSLRRVNGVLPLVLSAIQRGYDKFILPEGNAKEASYVPGVKAYCFDRLGDVTRFLSGELAKEPVETRVFGTQAAENKYHVDFSEVKGQQVARRALEIAVAGGHNILMIGPPGAGKTLMAKCVPTIMPDMTFEEAIEVTKIHSIAGVLDPDKGIVTQRPFRTPHHTVTPPALMGGGAKARPGEVSLAHNGVLFLDEMPEYERRTLEGLRQPLEDGVVTVSRSKQTLDYPADFMLIASMNPCPCGNYGSKTRQCRCSPSEIRRYVSRLSGPLLDRIDLQVEVDGVGYEELRFSPEAECSADIKKRVESARAMQRARYGSGLVTNAGMSNAQLRKYCALTPDCESILKRAFDKLNMTARASTRVLKVARTIADLAGSETILAPHITEAVQYRSLDRKYWE